MCVCACACVCVRACVCVLKGIVCGEVRGCVWTGERGWGGGGCL